MYEIYERLLKLHGITTADVCKATGINESTISNWKKRRNKLSAKNATIIADYFKVSIDYLMTGKTHETTDYVYYEDAETRDLVDFIHKNPEHKVLMDAARAVKPEDIDRALRIIGLFTDEYKDGN